MRNFVAPGKNVTITAAAAVLAGAGVIKGNLFGVATTDAGAGKLVELTVEGVFSFPKKAGEAVTEGAAAYFDNVAKTFTDVSAVGLYQVGQFVRDNAAGDATCLVRLSGAPTFPAP